MNLPKSVIAAISFGHHPDAVVRQAANVAVCLETGLRLLQCGIGRSDPPAQGAGRAEVKRRNWGLLWFWNNRNIALKQLR